MTTTRSTPLLVHVAGASLASAIAAYWAMRVFTPVPVLPAAPQPTRAPPPDAALAGRMFGALGGGPALLPDIRVSGVFAAGPDSSAVIAVGGRQPRAVLLGQEIAPGVRLVAVRADRVVLERAGVRAEFAVPPLAAAQPGGALAPFQRRNGVLTAPEEAPTPTSASQASPQGYRQFRPRGM